MRERRAHIVLTQLDGGVHPVRVFTSFLAAQDFLTRVAPHRAPGSNIAHFPTGHVALRTDCDRPIGNTLWIEDITLVDSDLPNRDGEQPPPAAGK